MRLVSILGDSVSTFEGYNPKEYAVFYNQGMQAVNALKSVYDTWWSQVIRALHAYLCVNDAYSGSRVSGREFPSAECDERLRNLRTEEYDPDMILVYLGFNDFGYGVPVTGGKGFFSRKDPDCFESAYDRMLKGLKRYYPSSLIVCGTLLRTDMKGENGWKFPEHFGGTALEEYNEAIKRVVRKNTCFLADLSGTGIRYMTLDGSHPTAEGHRTFAEVWIRCLRELDLI